MAIEAESEQKEFIQHRWNPPEVVAALAFFSLARPLAPERVPVAQIFSVGKHRPELVVIFLALLELLKQGEVAVSKDSSSGEVFCSKVKDG